MRLTVYLEAPAPALFDSFLGESRATGVWFNGLASLLIGSPPTQFIYSSSKLNLCLFPNSLSVPYALFTKPGVVCVEGCASNLRTTGMHGETNAGPTSYEF